MLNFSSHDEKTDNFEELVTATDCKGNHLLPTNEVAKKDSYNKKIFQRQQFDWQRTSRRNPCPICDHKDWCEISADGFTVHCMRVPGDKEVSWRGGGWLHFLFSQEADHEVSSLRNIGVEGKTVSDTVEVQIPPSQATPVASSINQIEPKAQQEKQLTPLASATQRTAAISWLLDRLELSYEHEAYLKSEDLLDIAFTQLQYRTLPADNAVRKELLDGLQTQFGREIVKALGFVYERSAKSGSYYLEFAGVLRGAEALIIPIRDLTGQPVALKARSIDPQTGERVYRVMSAGNTDRGAGVGTPVHVAQPLTITPGLKKWIIITEGEKKADYVAHQLGVTTLGVQGVSNWRSGKLLPLLRELEVEQVVEAFDADRIEQSHRGKENIERQARLLSEQCAAAGYNVYSARWPLEVGKGLDDFLRQQLQGNNEISWPDLHRFKPIDAVKSGQEPENEADNAFRQRYGFSRERVGRIARQFIEVESDTSTPVEYFLAEEKALKETVPLEKARLELNEIFGAAFAQHILTKGEASGRILLRTTTGTGKTTAAHQQIIQHLALGRPGRILYLADTKQAYAHLFGDNGILEAERLAGRVAIREGRTDKPGDYHCERLEDCTLLGANRQPASVDVCGSCPFGSPVSWKSHAASYDFDPQSPRPFECEKQGYLASVRRCKEAQVVIAPKAAILNGSNELAEFDFIIIDEDTVGYLLECQELTVPHLDIWEEERRKLETKASLKASLKTGSSLELLQHLGEDAKNDDDDENEEPEISLELLRQRHTPFDELFELVKVTLKEFELAGNQAGRVHFMPLLHEKAVSQGADLGQLVRECRVILPSHRFRRYQWERPYHHHLSGKLITPLRFARDLVELIERELDNEEGGDTRLWLERRPGLEGGTAIVAYLPCQHLIEVLSGTRNTYSNYFKLPPTVFFLDATAGPVFHLAVPGVEAIEVKVPQPLYIIQTTNSLYTGRSLQNNDGKALTKISRAIDGLVKRVGSRRPVVFSRKCFNPDFSSNRKKTAPAETIQAIPEERSNRESDQGQEEKEIKIAAGSAGGEKEVTLQLATAGVRYGHFERHNKGLDDYADADFLAIVGHYSQPLDEIIAQVQAFRGRSNSLSSSERTGNWQLKAYGWRGANGKGLARWCKTHPDPLIQKAIEHSTLASILQTIGRGRAALRAEEQPLVVALFTSLPLPCLEINELTDIYDLLEQKRITEKQAEALKAGRELANTRRHNQKEAIERIEVARNQLVEVGQPYVSFVRFAKIAEVSTATLRSLGYGWGGRWVRIAEIPAVVPLEMFIAHITNPAIFNSQIKKPDG